MSFKVTPSGRRQHLLLIEKNFGTGEDQFGQQIKDYQEFARVYGWVQPRSGREFFAAQQIQADVTHIINIAFCPGIVPEMRINFDGRFLHIEAVLNVQERNIELDLMCREAID